MTTIPSWEREPDGTDDIEKALELIEKRAHMPDIDAKELTLMVAYQMQLTLLLTSEQALGEMLVEEKLSLLKGEDLHEGSKEDIQEWREQIERHKARLRKTVEKDKMKVREILKDAGLA